MPDDKARLAGQLRFLRDQLTDLAIASHGRNPLHLLFAEVTLDAADAKALARDLGAAGKEALDALGALDRARDRMHGVLANVSAKLPQRARVEGAHGSTYRIVEADRDLSPIDPETAIASIRHIAGEAYQWVAPALDAAAKGLERPRKKTKQRKPGKTIPLTEKQLEAVHIVGECKGNIAEAARRIGKDHKTVKQHYDAGMKKMGKAAVTHKSHSMPKDRRDQENITKEDDRRGI